MRTGGTEKGRKWGRRSLPLLALLALVFRVLLPVAAMPEQASGAKPAVHDHGHAGHHAPAADSGGGQSHDEGPEHQACHFCRLPDSSLPPPAQRLVARTVPPTGVDWPAPRVQPRAAGEFLVVVRARAPPSGPV
ncbi:DUF2946 family protein [Skermanella mucosa]|uniref:DUF2946 family protein n=1 Tax=Skermanella mucosa TaxID=1789672 RepID=UPI00192AE343|nr:DUF2946 family protein [Skermanella mucosa]UEM22484.1 DUF2946 family protein [Skermanella mucosa]